MKEGWLQRQFEAIDWEIAEWPESHRRLADIKSDKYDRMRQVIAHLVEAQNSLNELDGRPSGLDFVIRDVFFSY